MTPTDIANHLCALDLSDYPLTHQLAISAAVETLRPKRSKQMTDQTIAELNAASALVEARQHPGSALWFIRSRSGDNILNSAMSLEWAKRSMREWIEHAKRYQCIGDDRRGYFVEAKYAGNRSLWIVPGTYPDDPSRCAA